MVAAISDVVFFFWPILRQFNTSSAEMALVRAAAQLRLQLESQEQYWAERYDDTGASGCKSTNGQSVPYGRVLESLGLKHHAERHNTHYRRIPLRTKR